MHPPTASSFCPGFTIKMMAGFLPNILPGFILFAALFM